MMMSSLEQQMFQSQLDDDDCLVQNENTIAYNSNNPNYYHQTPTMSVYTPASKILHPPLCTRETNMESFMMRIDDDNGKCNHLTTFQPPLDVWDDTAGVGAIVDDKNDNEED